MKIDFFKYHGCGNDFIILDNRKNDISLTTKQVAFLCDRHFGIGADGLMLLEETGEADFKMRYFNSDGGEATMCGNGGRCIVAFAARLGIIDSETEFLAVDGLHRASIKTYGNISYVDLKMQDVDLAETTRRKYIDTGSPHVVKFVDDLQNYPVKDDGASIRYSSDFKDINGVNVNFLKEEKPGVLSIRTYERGVENETLACGTGATASALFYGLINALNQGEVKLKTRGGELKVRYRISGMKATEVWLSGPAEMVFSGSIEI